MSELRYTQGNLIILYAIYRGGSCDVRSIPDHIQERVKVCLGAQRIITSSKPDSHKTTLVIVANTVSGAIVKEALLKGGVNEKVILTESRPKNISQTLSRILDMVKGQTNPPHIYFVGSVWQKDIFDSIVLSKFKGYKVQFEGALDHRPVYEVDQDRAQESPKRKLEYYKRKGKDKGIDLLLNYVFREK
jgi:hypothetical protein